MKSTDLHRIIVAISVKLNGGRVVTGVLRGFDPYMNIVLDDAIEERTSSEKYNIGMVVSCSQELMVPCMYLYSGTSIIWTPLGPYQTVIIIGVPLVRRLIASVHRLTSHTPQLVGPTCIIEIIQTSKRRLKGGLIESIISIFWVLV